MRVGRKRKHGKHLPRGVTHEHGAYYFRGKDRKRVRLGSSLAESLAVWAAIIKPEPGEIQTMHDAFERYKLEVLPRRAAKTQRNQGYMFPVIDAVFGTMDPRSLRPQHGYAFLDARAAQLREKRQKQGKAAGISTSPLKEFKLASSVLTKCVEWGVIDRNPFWQVRKGEYTPPSRTRCPTDVEFAAVYALANERLQIAMDLALLTGLRRTGILSLTMDCITDAGLLVERPGKKTKPLLFEITPELEAVLERARKLEPRVRRALLCAARGEFAGKPYTADGFSAMWQRLMAKAIEEKAIAERFTFNDIRAKSATDSDTVLEASERLGHASTSTTKGVYIRKPTKVSPLRRASGADKSHTGQGYPTEDSEK